MAIGFTSYVDIGALQRQEGGGGTAQTSYVDIGAAQRQEASADTALPVSRIYNQAVHRAANY